MSERIRWDDGEDGFGYVGTIPVRVFTIWPPEEPGGEWMLTSVLPGLEGDHQYGSGPGELKGAAEEWLAEFVSSLGARFGDEAAEFEFPRDSLDLEVAYAPGAYVRYQHPDAGWPGEQDEARILLTHGRLYRVTWNEIGQSRTRIGLVGVEGSFNSVLFEPVVEEDVTDAEAAEVARRSVRVERPAPCAECGGTGRVEQWTRGSTFTNEPELWICGSCNGTGDPLRDPPPETTAPEAGEKKQ